ncbi:MAG: hypothetical protein H0T83_10295 [Chthoniobacterales bacterium]|nr:hypothetical protein [Chthoniobacterales bacterium]
MKRFSRSACLAALLVLALSVSARVGESSISAREALQYFKEVDAISRADGGRLWGVSLNGPLLLVDPETRIAYANQPDQQGRLQRAGEVLRGEIPTEINLANTAFDWAGTKWSMVMLPLPEDRHVRATLLIHELWHRIQDKLGLPSADAQNAHLDSRDGRYWLQLEWRALAAALAASGSERNKAISDAVLFRERRRAIFAGSGGTENAMEMHEGLAEYTGVALSGAPDPAKFVIDHELKDAPGKKTFVRSFAYASGPAYGLLLDATGQKWRENLSPKTDLAATLLHLSDLKLPDDVRAAAGERSHFYGGESLAAQEDERETSRRKLIARYRARLVDGPVLGIPLHQMQMQFDPGNLVPLDSLGTVYPNIRIVDDWGVLTVSDGDALLKADFSEITLPNDGEGWNSN